jgi:hypothetical protein
MVVNVDTLDKTWQIHLNGLLVILRQCRDLTIEFKPIPLLMAVQIMGSQNVAETISTLPLSSVGKAGILLDFTKLRLRRLNTELNKLCEENTHPRKLDIQKIRRLAKELHDNLLLIPSMLPEEQHTIMQPAGTGKNSALQYNTESSLPSPSPSFAGDLVHGQPNCKISSSIWFPLLH